MQDFVIGMTPDIDKASGKKVHWYNSLSNNEIRSYTPCGGRTKRLYSVPKEYFSRVDEKDRCKRCNTAFLLHQKNLPKVGQIEIHNQWKMPKFYCIITKVEYLPYTYRKYKIKELCFFENLNNIFERDMAFDINEENTYKENTIFSEKEIEDIRRLYRIIND